MSVVRVCVHVHLYACAYASVSSVFVLVCARVSMHVCVRASVCGCVCVCTNVSACVDMCTCVCMCVHMPLPSCLFRVRPHEHNMRQDSIASDICMSLCTKEEPDYPQSVVPSPAHSHTHRHAYLHCSMSIDPIPLTCPQEHKC